MSTQSDHARNFVKNWLPELQDKRMSRGDIIGTQYLFSSEAHECITEGSFTDDEIYKELMKHRAPTPARHLLRLHLFDKKSIKQAIAHCEKGKTGATITHLNLLSDVLERKKLLHESIKNNWSAERLRTEVGMIARRPSIAIRKFNKVTKGFKELVNAIADPGFFRSIDIMDPKRVLQANTALNEALEELKIIEQTKSFWLKKVREINIQLSKRLARHAD